MKLSFNKIINSDFLFVFILIIFFLSLAITVYYRAGKDLKVGLFGVVQVLQKHSPYQNPTDPNRTIFRYAPGITILEYPFLLKSKMVSPFEFKDILPSVFLWYFAEILALLIIAILLLKLIPAFSPKIQTRNLKLSFLMALPFIGSELSNSQNKIFALLFMLMAIFLFERKRMLLSAISFCLALTIYIPLSFFIFYFLLRTKGKFLVSFIVAALIVFVLAPSLVFGYKFNNYLLKEWFNSSLKPFFFTNSYESYIDLRHSSQSLPSAIGRIFVSGKTGYFKYALSPIGIHMIVRILSAIIVVFSCFAIWKHSKIISRGLNYAIFLILALILPMYCIYYTWAWLFVIYVAVFNCISYPEVSVVQKRPLLITTFILFILSCSIGVAPLSNLSFIFWGTIIAWFGIVTYLIQEKFAAI